MTTPSQPLVKNRRILVIDDNPAIHDDFRKVLGADQSRLLQEIEEEEALIFGESKATSSADPFEIDFAFQGKEGLDKVRQAAAAGKPYAIAFVDVRMPPGWDGVETISHIWREFPDLQIVICTAYSDYSWDQIVDSIGSSDSVLILKKPFDSVEVLQMAHALTRKWELASIAARHLAELDRLVSERTRELRVANEELKREITERTAAEAALRLLEERFSKAFHACPIAMAIRPLHRSGYLDVNASFIALVDFAHEELSRPDAAPGIWSDETAESRIFEMLRKNEKVQELSAEVITRTGETRHVLVSAESIQLGGEHHALLYLRDVTERLRLEEDLRQAQKMEAVGRLAAGIAHDFNNLLTVIMATSSIQLNRPMLDQKMAASLRQIVGAAERATELTRQLLAFSRKQILRRRTVDLNAAVSATCGLLKRLIGETIAIHLELDPAQHSIHADPSNVDQVIMNLAVNARDAMPDGGTLSISTSFVPSHEVRPPGDVPPTPGDYIRLSVKDTGVGMSPSTLSRIFEPFFTTKEVGRGTGMGLATVYGIMKQHDGWVDVQSEVGRGTTFDLYFPVSRDGKETAPKEAPAEAPAAPPLATATILLVEDEDMLREIVATVLQSYGHRVLSAANGLEALEIWEREKESVRLLLTDVVMPHQISGRQLATRLTNEKHDLKVIYTSGYSAELIGDDLENSIEHTFLPKPFITERLVQIVSQCLASPDHVKVNVEK